MKLRSGTVTGSASAIRATRSNVKFKPEIKKGELKLYLDHPVRCELPNLDGYHAVRLTNLSYLPTKINGRDCTMFVDCGTSSVYITHERAEELALLDKIVEYRRKNICTWT